MLATESSACVLILCCGISAGGRIAGAVPNIGNFLEFGVFFLFLLMCFSDKLNFDDSVINRVTEKSRQKEADM